MRRRSIFVSHASANKRALEPLVRAFILCGYKVFVDNPVHGNWSFHASEIEAWVREDRFAQIRNAKDWLAELQMALGQCDVVLLCLSNELSEIGPELMAEMIIADREGKLVACALPGTDFEKIKARAGMFRVGAAQAILVDPETVWAAVQRLLAPEKVRDPSIVDPDLHTFQHLLLEIAKDPADRLDGEANTGDWVKRDSASSPVDDGVLRAVNRSLHRAGRGGQRQHFKSALKLPGVQVRVVSGPENEHVVDFVEALQGEGADGKDALHDAYVMGPIYLPNGSNRNDVFLELASSVIEALPEQPEIDGGDFKALAAHLSARPTPLVCVSDCYSSAAVKGQWSQVRLWREFWRELDAAGEGGLQVMALLLVELDPAEPGWQIHPATGFDFPLPPDAQNLNPSLFKQFMQFVHGGVFASFFGRAQDQHAPFGIVSPVCPLSKTDIRAWIRSEHQGMEGRDLDAAEEIMSAVGAAAKSGMTMEQLRRAAPVVARLIAVPRSEPAA